MATQNSIDAYIELADSGELGERQQEVLRYIYAHPNCSYNDIARDMRLHHNTVTARIKELRDMGYIVCSGSKVDYFTHKTNAVYRLRRDGEAPDDTTRDARPILPREIYEFLRAKTCKGASDGEQTTTYRNVRYIAKCSNGAVSLDYGTFLKLDNIMVACADNSQGRVIVSGVNFTVDFKIN